MKNKGLIIGTIIYYAGNLTILLIKINFVIIYENTSKLVATKHPLLKHHYSTAIHYYKASGSRDI